MAGLLGPEVPNGAEPGKTCLGTSAFLVCGQF